jgi:hypothetical protein
MMPDFNPFLILKNSVGRQPVNGPPHFLCISIDKSLRGDLFKAENGG